MSLDGTESGCAEADDPPTIRSSAFWSPDGRTVAYDTPGGEPLRSSIRLFDITSLEVRDVPGQRATEDRAVDVLPVWLDDETLAFFRHDGDPAAPFSDSIVTATTDGRQVPSPTSYALDDLALSGPAAVMSTYFMSVQRADGAHLAWSVLGEDGLVDYPPAPTLFASDVDGSRIAIVSYDSDNLELFPVGIVDAVVDDDGNTLVPTIASDVTALSASLEPPVVTGRRLDAVAGQLAAHTTRRSPGSHDRLASLSWARPHEGAVVLRGLEYSWEHVRDLSVYGESTRQMTVPLLRLLGVFAYFFQKHERHVRLRLADDRGAWVFDVPGISVRDLSSGIAHVRRQHLSPQHH